MSEKSFSIFLKPVYIKKICKDSWLTQYIMCNCYNGYMVNNNNNETEASLFRLLICHYYLLISVLAIRLSTRLYEHTVYVTLTTVVLGLIYKILLLPILLICILQCWGSGFWPNFLRCSVLKKFLRLCTLMKGNFENSIK